MVKEEHRLVIRPKIDIEKDKIFMEMEIPEGFRELLKNFAVPSKYADFMGVRRHLVKNIIVQSSDWKDAYNVFFIKDLIKHKKCVFEVESVGRINEIKNQFNEIKNLVKLMMSALVTEETTYIVSVEKQAVEQVDEEDEN